MPVRLRRGAPPLSFLLLLTLFVPPASSAQVDPLPADSLRREILQLRAELDSIKALLARGQGMPEQEEDALARLRAAARRAAQGGAEAAPDDREQFVSRARSLQALNPEISVSGDLFAILQSEATDENNFVPREFEFSFQSALDPFSRAKIFLSAEEEGGGVEVFSHGEEEEEHGVALVVEEAYLEWVNLGGGLSVKVGRFFQQLGQLNRFHAHALPFQGRSLPHLVFVGEESLAQDGVSLRWLLPGSPLGGAYEISLEGTRSRNEVLFGESNGPGGLAHLNAFWQTSDATDLEVGVSGVIGDHAVEDAVFRNRLFAVESAFNWAPPSQSRYRGVSIRAGVMLSDPESAEAAEVRERALGVWGLAEAKLSRQWIAGGRYGWVENPDDTAETAWLVAPALTYWQSEFVRIRAEYDFISSTGDTSGIFTVRVTFAMGPHKHETY